MFVCVFVSFDFQFYVYDQSFSFFLSLLISYFSRNGRAKWPTTAEMYLYFMMLFGVFFFQHEILIISTIQEHFPRD